MRNKAELMRSQSGQILIFTTVIVMLAALILVPLMEFTFTSHRSAKIREGRTLELYASDAGIEDSLYQIKTEKKGTDLSNLGFGADSSYNLVFAGTAGMNDRTMNVGVQKIWIPEGDEVPSALQTEAPTTDTDKSSRLVVVGMLSSIQATAASDDFNSGSWSGGNGTWTGNWTHTGSAGNVSSTQGCGGSGYALGFTDADGYAERTANLLKYMKPQLKFNAKASSLEAGDTVDLKVKYGDSDWKTPLTWGDGNESSGCNAFNINLYDLYGWAGNDTSVPLQVAFDANLSAVTVAQDNFDSGNWTGGLGWSGGWVPSSGGASVTSTGGLPTHSGSWHLRLAGASSSSSRGSVYRRISNIPAYSGSQLVLQVYAKRNSWSSSGDSAYVEMRSNERGWTIIDTWARSRLTTSYQPMTIALPYTSSATWYEIRFRADMNASTEIVYIDDVQITDGDSFYVDNLWTGDEYNSNTIEIAYTDANLGDAFLDRIGVWMPPGCHYVSIVGNETTPELSVGNLTVVPSTYADGTILEWDFAFPGVELHKPALVMPKVKTLTFTYEVDVAQHVEGMFTWIKAHGPGGQTYLSWDKGYEIYKSVSQAHSEIYGTNTEVTAYVAQGEVNKKNAASYGDYAATGNPLLIDYVADSGGVKETAVSPSDPYYWYTKDGFLYDGRSDITSIPNNAEVVAGWLYWSAFMNNSDWVGFGSQPDTNVSFMYPKRYGPETFAVHAGDGNDTYTTAAWGGAQEPMDLLAHEPVLTLSPMRYWGENLGIAVQGNGNDTFFSVHKPILSTPSLKVRVGGTLRTEGTDYVVDYATGNITIIKDTLSGQVVIDYSVDGLMTLTKGTDYSITQTTFLGDVRYTGFTVGNDNLEGEVIVDYYCAKHWEAVQHAAYDMYGTPLAPAQTEVPLTNHVGHSYACFADVTELLTGNGTYTACTGKGQYAVDNVKATNGVNLTEYATRCFSGWSLIVLYKSATGTAHQFYLYDPIHNAADCPFMVRPNTDFSPQPEYINVPFTLNDFYPPEGTVEGRTTYFVGEGDTTYTGDSVGFKGASQPSYTYLSGVNNPVDDVMNTVSTTGEKGIDIDTYEIWDEVGSDTQANVNLRTQGDRWYLVYMILSFKTNEVPKADYAFSVASVTYQYELGGR